MRNLLLILIRYGGFITFILLEILCFYLIITFNKSQREVFINSSNLFTGFVYTKGSEINDYLNLKEIADDLAKTNAKLINQTYQDYIPASTKADTIRLDSLTPHYTIIPARVRNNSVVFNNNNLTLDKGSIHGLKKGMGVISDDGLVGIVRIVSPHYSRVLSLLNRQTRISAALKKNGYFGVLRWTGNNPQYMDLENIDRAIPISQGDTIVTSGYSSIFPPGIVIGFVDKFVIKKGTNFYSINVRLNNDLRNLHQAYVINNLYQAEQLGLENMDGNE